MTEPIYSYKKGEGWVPSLTHSNIKVNYRGAEYVVEHRIPSPGELYIAFDKVFFKNAPSSEEPFLDEIRQNRVWPNKVPSGRDPISFHYFTLVPL